jgi:hypothetical protein
MALILTTKGAEMILGAYFNNTWPDSGNDLTLRLFTNNIIPSPDDTSASYVEVTGGNYTAITLTRGSWTINPALDPREADYTMRTFTFNGALTGNPSIYGYYITDADDNLIIAERATALFTPSNDGDSYEVTPKIQMSWGTPSI